MVFSAFHTEQKVFIIRGRFVITFAKVFSNFKLGFRRVRLCALFSLDNAGIK